MLTACYDDTFDDFKPITYPEGTTSIKLNIDFAPLAGADLASRASDSENVETTNAQAGDIIKGVKDFTVLFFDTRLMSEKNSPLLTCIKHFSAADVQNKTNGITAVDEQVKRQDGDASDGQPLAEEYTTHIEAKVDGIPYGPYIIYAVANLGGSQGTTREALTEAGIVPENVCDFEDLKFVKAYWDSSNMLNNAQMTGYFTEGTQSFSPGTGSAPTEVKIMTPNASIHSWLRRLVSKVTIDYDATKMRNGVTVTIKKVSIRDIARSCYLGNANKLGGPEDEGLLNTDGYVEDGYNHCIVYDEPIVLTSATTDYPKSAKFEGEPHRESDPALFFFENMQGEVPDKDNHGKLQDGKLQDENGDGKIDYPDGNDINSKDYKDGVPYGTFVEVEAEYDAKTVGHIGRGTIKYRFMIGKNVTTNCDAERNHHYKLKLSFLGNANEVDWHIDYDETPGFYGPNPYYVSYSYNRMTYYPIKISGEVVGDVTLTIFQNAWWPNNAVDYTYMNKTSYGKDEDGNIINLKNDEGLDSVGINQWNLDDRYLTDGHGSDWNKLYIPSDNYAIHPADYPLQPWNGFLSLRQAETNNTTTVFSETVLDKTDKDWLFEYWIGAKGWKTNVAQERGRRVYSTTVRPNTYTGSASEGRYYVTKDENSTTINVPFFTREKQLAKVTAYTGANPFVGFQREAKVKLDYSLKIGDEVKSFSDTIKVYQVKRLCNPSGIFRSPKNTKPFHVLLMEQRTETSTNFIPVKSIGPWRAYISRGNTDFITLNGKTEVRGGDGSPIDFNVNFRGPAQIDENHCAIIRVEYNNYSCHHLIFVRQGNAPIDLNESCQVLWHTANVQQSGGTSLDDVELVDGLTPLDEGSLFKYGNLVRGITSVCNPMLAAELEGREIRPEDFDPSKNTNPSFALMSNGAENVSWNGFASRAMTDSFPDYVKLKALNDEGVYEYVDGLHRLPTVADYQAIVSNETGTASTGNQNIEYDYGVLYGDESTETASNVVDAFGFFVHPFDDSQSMKARGMRGVFVYNNSTSVARLGGNHIFLPLGRSGYGRRKHNVGVAWNGTLGSNGVLQYAGRPRWYQDNSNSQYLPLFYDIFRSRGALYWPRKIEGSNVTLDINNKTYDFSINDLGYGVEGKSDACFVRLVTVKPNSKEATSRSRSAARRRSSTRKR